MPAPAHLSLLIAALGVRLAAQSAWIVDAAGRPGTHFLDLPTAVAAAAAGDTIIVWPAATAYAPATIGKGLTVITASTVPAIVDARVSPLVVQGLPAGQRCMLGGLQFVPGSTVVVDTCAGLVLLDGLGGYIGLGRPGAVAVRDSGAVSLAHCVLQGAEHEGLSVLRSVVTVSGTYVCGGSTTPPGSTAPLLAAGVHAEASMLDFGATKIVGQGRAPALELVRSAVTVGAASALANAVAGDGAPETSLVIDPATERLGAFAIANVPVTWRTAPALEMAYVTAPVPSLSCRLWGQKPGDFVATWLGPPAPPLRSSLGALWLDPLGSVLVQALQVDPTGAVGFDFVVPSHVAWPRAALAAQSLVLEQTTDRLAFSTPAFVVLR